MSALLSIWLWLWLKIRPWVKRYGLAEVCGTVALIAAGWLCARAGLSAALASGIADLAETIGFFAPLAIREFCEQHARHRHYPWRKRHQFTVVMTIRDLLLEFGIGGIADFFLRPVIMLWMAVLLHHVFLGIVVGKLLCDVVFYAPTILSYLLKRRVLYADECEPAPTPELVTAAEVSS